MDSGESKTIGQIVSRLDANKEVSSEEIDSRLPEFEKTFYKTLDTGMKEFSGDFYIEVKTKKEKALLGKVLRNYFITKEACPRPDYDQILYRIDKKKENVELLWSIPKKEACEFIRDNGKIAVTHHGIHENLFRDVSLFIDGTLMRLCHKLNSNIKESKRNSGFDPNKEEDTLIIQA